VKKVQILKPSSIDTQEFDLGFFVSSSNKSINKKLIKSLADELGLEYDKSKVEFAKEILKAYIEKN
jgi:hypothetical protein